MPKIFLERDMDYYIYDTVEAVNAKTAELIIEDRYDFLIVHLYKAHAANRVKNV